MDIRKLINLIENASRLIKEDTQYPAKMSPQDMLAYLRKVMAPDDIDAESHTDWRNNVLSHEYFVLKDAPVKSFKLDSIGIDIDREKVEKYKKMGFSTSPLVVVDRDGYLIDGYHRTTAANELNIPSIQAYVGISKGNKINEDTTDNTFYHITPAKNVKSIKQDGLSPKIGRASLSFGETEERVYLFPSLIAAEDAVNNWLGNQEEDIALALLEVDASDIDLKSDVEWEFYTNQTIPPNRIKILSMDM